MVKKTGQPPGRDNQILELVAGITPEAKCQRQIAIKEKQKTVKLCTLTRPDSPLKISGGTRKPP